MERDKEHFLFYCFDSKNDCRNFISETSESASVKICEYWFRRKVVILIWKTKNIQINQKSSKNLPKALLDKNSAQLQMLVGIVG